MNYDLPYTHVNESRRDILLQITTAHMCSTPLYIFSFIPDIVFEKFLGSGFLQNEKLLQNPLCGQTEEPLISIISVKFLQDSSTFSKEQLSFKSFRQPYNQRNVYIFKIRCYRRLVHDVNSCLLGILRKSVISLKL